MPICLWQIDFQHRCQVPSIVKEESLHQMVLGQLYFHMKKNEVEPYFTPHVKTDSRWIYNLNVRAKIIKLLEENTGKSS